MSQTGSLEDSYLKKERVFVGVFLFVLCLSLMRAVHNGWVIFISMMAQHPPVAGTAVYYLFRPVPPPLYAPDAYRVAIPALGEFLLKTLPLSDPAIVAGALDFIFSFSALYLFYRLAVDRLSVNPPRAKERMLLIALFLAFVQLPIAWVVPWQRPETLPSALFVAVALCCLVRARRIGLWSLLLFVATAFQAFVRSDVAFVFGVALIFASFAEKTLQEFGSRSSNILKGVGIALIAGGVQVYLEFARFPHLHYWPGADVVQFRNNLHFHNLSNCMIALLPFALLAVFPIVKRIHLDAVDVLILVASALYFPLWFAVGVIAEVRIYVPFLLALSVVAAKVAASFMTDDEVRAAE